MDFRSLFASRRVKDGQWDKVSGIKGYKFSVKYYQRGYRWTKGNIRKLLSDIDKYISEDACKFYEILDYVKASSNKNDKTDLFDFYCLQALSVKEIEGKKYELIDGQQRLTSVFMIYEFLNLFINSSDERSEKPYEIIYDRGGGKEFNLSEYLEKSLPVAINGVSTNKAYKMDRSDDRTKWFNSYKQELKTALTQINPADELIAGKSLAIDLFYMSEVALEIVDYIMQYNDAEDDSSNLKKFFDFLRWNTLFIWYEIPQTINAKAEFVSLNSNKIKLTNAELIKALVLRKDENGKAPENGGNRWESIEQGLFQGDLWAFISGENKATRIELILELFARQNGYCPPPFDENENALFDWFEEYSKYNGPQSKFAQDIIDGIEASFNRICEWYDDVEIYHYIGLLTQYRQLKLMDALQKKLTQEELIKLVFDKYGFSNCKQDFISELKKIIKECILKGSRDTSILGIIDESTFSYDESRQQANIKAILWALNVWETINASENNEGGKRKQSVVRRLPFSQVNGPLKGNDLWTLEHIMPQNPADDSSQEDKNEYAHFKAAAEKDGARIIDETEIHEIGNMALLRKADNSSIHNADLQKKRKELTQRAIGEGSYVPSATINAFGLYYNMLSNDYQYSPIDDKYWTKTDRDNYLSRIKACLEDYNV